MWDLVWQKPLSTRVCPDDWGLVDSTKLTTKVSDPSIPAEETRELKPQTYPQKPVDSSDGFFGPGPYLWVGQQYFSLIVFGPLV